MRCGVLLSRLGEERAPGVLGIAEHVGCERSAFIRGRAGFDGCLALGAGAAAAEQAHDQLRATDEVGDDGEHDAAEAELEAATTAGALTAVVFDILALSTVSPAH